MPIIIGFYQKSNCYMLYKSGLIQFNKLMEYALKIITVSKWWNSSLPCW